MNFYVDDIKTYKVKNNDKFAKATLASKLFRGESLPTKSDTQRCFIDINE